jgi:tRNA (cmo5U34)-methyltransferase
MTTTQAKWQEAYRLTRAREYDRFIELAAMNYRGALEAVVEAASWAAPRRILELGAGTGTLTRMLLEHFPEAQVTAVDGSAEMLEKAAEKLRPFGDRVKLERAVFERILDEGPGGSYDLIVSSFALHHMSHEDMPRFFCRLHASLSPAGRLVVADYVLTSYPGLQRRYEGVWVDWRRRNMKAAFGIEQSREGAFAEHEATKRAEGDNPAPLEHILGWLRGAGFQEAECHWKYYCYAVYGGQRP